MPEDITKKVLQEIERKKICPTAKWCFVCKNYSFWAIVALSAIIVSLALSLMIFLFFSHDWDVYRLESGNLFHHILDYTPYFWIIIFLLFILLAIYGIGKTKEGYKFENCRCAGVLVLIIITASLVSVFAGASSLINEKLHKKVPLYNAVLSDKRNIWDEPQKGLLAGEVVNVKDKENFMLKDFKDNNWDVQEEKNIKMIPPNYKIKKGEKIKMIGKPCAPCGSNVFIVNTIKPW